MPIVSSPLALNAVKELMDKPYNSKMFDAHVSFCEGVGALNYEKSRMLFEHNMMDYDAATESFLAPWTTKVDGEVKDWLLAQRKEEQALYNMGVIELLAEPKPKPKPKPKPEPDGLTGSAVALAVVFVVIAFMFLV